MLLKALTIVCLSSLPYFFNLGGDFVFDDSEAIVKNKDVTMDSWTNCFNNDFWGTNIKSNLSHKSYRPLTTLSFRLNYYSSGKQLSVYHFKITNLFCHTLCSLLVWLAVHNIQVTLRIAQRSKKHLYDTAFLTSILFSVHPVHVEAVSGIVGRADILAAVSFFLSFIAYNKAMSTRRYSTYLYLIGSIILAGVSMLFKENGITVLGFCLCYELITKIRFNSFKSKTKLKSKEKYLSTTRVIITVLSTVLILYGRWHIMGGTTPEFKATDNPTAFSSSVFIKIATYSYIYFLNMLLLIWPQWLCYDWSMGCVPLIEHVMDYRLIFAISIYLYALLVIRVILIKENMESSKRMLILAMALMTLPFLPAANIFYPVGFVIAERVLYIPSAGYCLFVAIGLDRILKKHSKYKTAAILFYLLIFFYTLKSLRRSIDWGNEHELFVSAATVCPLNAKVHYNIAKALDAKNQTDLAVASYKQSISLYPGYYQAMNNLGNILKNHGQLLEAEYYLRAALKQKREFPAAWMNLGIVLAGTDRFEESEMAYNIALEYRRDYPDCFYNMGNLYLETNQTQKAMGHWLKAVTSNPKHVLAWTNLLAFLDNSDDLLKALELVPIALTQLPKSPAINFAVANIYGKMERYEEAERHFQKAIRLFGSNTQPLHYSNLGVLYHRWKKYDLAEKMYKNALLIDPSFRSAQKNLRKLQRFL